jgi:fumarate hydratase subunit alpha
VIGGLAHVNVLVSMVFGGTIDMTTLIAKKALLRPLGEHHPQPEVAALEKELLEEINKLGIGELHRMQSI